jgi:microcystin-dependent protein
MAQPYVGEIRMFAGNFAPVGWMFCEGQLLPISENSPTGNVPAGTQAATITPYGTDAPNTTLHPSSVSPIGGSQPHTNFQPYLCIDFIISLFGIFPSPS